MQDEKSGCHFQDKSHVNWNISVSFLLTAPIKGADYMQSFDERGARGAAVIGQLFCGSLSLQCRQCSNQKVACNLLNYYFRFKNFQIRESKHKMQPKSGNFSQKWKYVRIGKWFQGR